MNVKMKNLFPSSKSRHTFCRVHRVYGMQNDRLDLTIILAEKNRKKMLCSQRYWQNKERKIFEKVQISLATEHFLPIFFSKNDPEIEPVVFHTINPMNFTKLEFQGPYGPLKNSSPCGGHARFSHTVSRFARKLTLEILDFVHRGTATHASFL